MAVFENELLQQGSRSLLVVDDEDTICELVAKLFEPDGYVVYAAGDVESAVRLIAEKPIGVVIIDKNLAGMKDGIDLLEHVAAHAPFAKSIILTGYASLESAIKSIRLGAFDYLTKPIDMDILRERVLRARAAYIRDCERSVANSRHETLFETIPGLVWFMTENGILKRINSRGASMLGYREDELVGERYDVLLANSQVPPPVHWAFKERRTAVRATRRQVVELKTREDDTRIFEVYSSGTYLDEKNGGEETPRRFWGTVGVAHDITDQIALQEQLQQAQRMEALGRLASGIAHDFNNLLSVICANVEFMRTSSPTGELSRELVEIETVATRATGLVRRLLSFCSQQSAAVEMLDPAQLVADMEPLLSRLVGNKIKLRIRSDERSGLVECDRTQLEQVVMNLAMNAKDAMPDGGTLTVHTRVAGETHDGESDRDTPAERVALVVTDTGVGMTDEVRRQAFDPFFSTKGEGEGSGLGLATVYGIVRQHGGQADIASRPGRGTSVTIYLPRHSAAREVLPPPTGVRVSPDGRLVLLVEDEEMVRRSAARILCEAGHTVLEASNGAEAAHLWETAKEDVELLVADIIMPGMSGTELAHELRRTRPDLPLVFISGQLTEEQAELSAFDGDVRFLRKPIHASRLLATVRAVTHARLDQA